MDDSLKDFDYLTKTILPQNLLDLVNNTNEVTGSQKHGPDTYHLTLTNECILWLFGKKQEIANDLDKAGYDEVPVLKVTGPEPKKIFYHPKTGEQLYVEDPRHPSYEPI